MNWIKEWIKNFKIHRIINKADGWDNFTIWQSIKSTTSMMFNK